MAFTVSAIAAKDGAGSTVTGGLLALDQTGSGPWIIVHSLVDGVAGSNRASIDASNRLAIAIADGAAVTLGAKADAKSTATDTTSITLMQAVKQISASAQLISTALGATALDRGTGAGGAATLRATIDSAQIPTAGQTTLSASVPVAPASDWQIGVTCSTDITRPADTNAYTANDTWSDSTSAPTAGGFTLTSAARASGKSGIITDIYICSSAVPGTLLQGELHIFDSAATAVNDNAAWNLSDSDAKLRVAIVAFTLVADANNSYYHAQNLNIGFTCVGTANLRYLVKVKNAYTPVSAEVLTVRAKIMQTS